MRYILDYGAPPAYDYGNNAPPSSQYTYNDMPPAYSAAPNNSLIGVSGELGCDSITNHIIT